MCDVNWILLVCCFRTISSGESNRFKFFFERKTRFRTIIVCYVGKKERPFFSLDGVRSKFLCWSITTENNPIEWRETKLSDAYFFSSPINSQRWRTINCRTRVIISIQCSLSTSFREKKNKNKRKSIVLYKQKCVFSSCRSQTQCMYLVLWLIESFDLQRVIIGLKRQSNDFARSFSGF